MLPCGHTPSGESALSQNSMEMAGWSSPFYGEEWKPPRLLRHEGKAPKASGRSREEVLRKRFMSVCLFFCILFIFIRKMASLPRQDS